MFKNLNCLIGSVNSTFWIRNSIEFNICLIPNIISSIKKMILRFMKLVVWNNNLGDQILYGSPDPPKKLRRYISDFPNFANNFWWYKPEKSSFILQNWLVIIYYFTMSVSTTGDRRKRASRGPFWRLKKNYSYFLLF